MTHPMNERLAQREVRPEQGLSLAVSDAYITLVTGTVNAVYDAITIDGLREVTGIAPNNRDFDTDDIDFLPATVGDPCLIMRGSGGDDFLYVFTETKGTIDCADVGGLTSTAADNTALSRIITERASEHALSQAAQSPR